MTMQNHTVDDTVLGADAPLEPVATEPVQRADSSVISFRASRHSLVIGALVMLLLISAFETLELTSLHNALKAWQALPAAAAAAPTASAPTSGGSALPSQVGGC